MPDFDFDAVKKRLLVGGIAVDVADRAVVELHDHYDDIVEEAVAQGSGLSFAQEQARNRIGSCDAFVAEMLSRRELKTWAFRYPRIALVVYPLACLASIPAIPVVRSVENAPTLARWGASLVFAGAVTLAMLLAMQMSILLG